MILRHVQMAISGGVHRPENPASGRAFTAASLSSRLAIQTPNQQAGFERLPQNTTKMRWDKL